MACLLTAGTTGCIGLISNGDSPGEGTPKSQALVCEGDSGPGIAVSLLQPLTQQEITNAVRFLLPGVGESTLIEAARFLPQDGRAAGFHANAEVPSDLSVIDGYQQFAEKVAAASMATVATWLPCNSSEGDACAKTAVRTLGRRAYRHSLTEEEQAQLDGLFAAGKALGTFNDGLQTLVEAMLQSPRFLYKVEQGIPTDTADVFQLTGTELASRLAFLLWRSPPDDALLDRAEAGELDAPEALADVIGDLLADPRARAGIETFHAEWLGLDSLLDEPKDTVAYPQYSAELAADMLTETNNYVYTTILRQHGTIADLLTSPTTYVNVRLAAHYEMETTGLSNASFEARPTPPERAGLFTQGSVLMKYAHADSTSVVHRGVLIREKFLCQTLVPPPNVETQTEIKRLETQPCAGCHTLLDPVGYGFERFDGIGKVQSNSDVDALVAQAALNGADEVSGPFSNIAELGSKLAQNPRVADCISEKWMTFLLQRALADEDACNVARARKTFEESGGTIEELIVAVLSSDLNRFRRQE